MAEVFDPDEMLPAAGQGALAVECAAGAPGLAALLAAADDPSSRAAVTAERSLLAALQGGCSAPVGAYAAHAPGADTVHLAAGVFDHDGSGAVRAAGSGAAAAARALGRQVAAELLRRGAGDYISVPAARPSNGGDPQ